MHKFIHLFVRDERGVSTMEYAVLAGIIVVALAALGTTTLTTDFQTMFTHLFTKVTAAVNNG